MHKIIRYLLWSLGAFSALLVLGVLLVLLASDTPGGRNAIETSLLKLSAGKIQLSGLNGDFPDQVSIAQIELHDAEGAWLRIDDLLLDWQPYKLLLGELNITRLQARLISVERLPLAAQESSKPGIGSLPVTIILNSLAIQRLDIAPSLAGDAASFELTGRLELAAKKRNDIELHIQNLEKQGTYSLLASLTAETLDAHLSLQEAAAGPLATLTGLSSQSELNVNASLTGPLTAVHTHMQLKLDSLEAMLNGNINWIEKSVDLMLSANAPAMKLRPDLAWQKLALKLQLQGALTRLTVNGDCALDKLTVGQAVIDSLSSNLQGRDGQIKVNGELAGLRLAASEPDLLLVEPLLFEAQVATDQPDFPATLMLKHRLLQARAQTTMHTGRSSANLTLILPELQPVATLLGLQMAGSANMALKFAQHDANSSLDVSGGLSLNGGDSVWTRLLGAAAKFDVGMSIKGQDIALTALHINGKSLSLSADGGLTNGLADFDWQLQLNKLADIIASESGQVNMQGKLQGPLDDFSLSSQLIAELANKAYVSESVHANLQLQHLPNRAQGQLSLSGKLLQAPLDISVSVNSPDFKTIQVDVDKANWKSLHAQGGLLFSENSALPIGNIDIKMERLADLQPLLKQPLSGSANASLEAIMHNKQVQANIKLAALRVAVLGSVEIAQTNLELNLRDVLGQTQMQGIVDVQGVKLGKLAGSAQIKLEGSTQALNLQMSATAPNLSGSAAQLSAAAMFDKNKNTLLCKALQASWQQHTLQLLAPATLSFKDGLSVDHLSLGMQQAKLELAGRLLPNLALTLELQQASVELLSQFSPIPAMTGTLSADANLHGSLSQPTGLLHITAKQLQLKNSQNQALPAAELIASAVLNAENAVVDATLKASDKINIQLGGQTPMTNSGEFALHGTAALDLKVFNPLLNAQGRQLQGQLLANATLAGTWSAPLLAGSAKLEHGTWQDFSTGVGISDISAALAIEQGSLPMFKLQARAGPGTLNASGSIDLLSADMPIDLTIIARNARPLASDQLTVNLDADVVLSGLLMQGMTASGRLHLNRADIQIPERLPASIAVLKLSDATPSATVASADEISHVLLNLSIDAPREIFIRGRGIDAELGGSVKVTGDLNHLHPDGNFSLRSGQYTLAGQVLVFNQGALGFADNSLTNPSLNFVAISTRNNITATVTITGTAQQPKIALSSSPTLPADEVLANLLFGKGAASLSTLEMVQIAAALGSMTGVTSGVGDPLESARKLLGLDRLSAGGVNPSLEAGRYIAPGVYLGAKQGISGGVPQPVVQIDISKHFKLEGGVGSGAAATSSAGSTATNSVGVIYQIEY